MRTKPNPVWGIRLDPVLVRRVKAFAALKGRPVGAVVADAIRRAIPNVEVR